MIKVILFLTLAALVAAKSPCPEIFNTDSIKKSDGKWEGVLNFDSEFGLEGMWVRIFLDKKAEKVEHVSAEVVTDDHVSWLFRMPNQTLEAGKTVHIPFTVTYDKKSGSPSLVRVRLNARDVCPENAEPVHVSPCPANFKYVFPEKPEDGRWYGELHVDSEFPLNGVWIRVFLDKDGKVLPNGFGEVESREHNSYLIRNKDHVIKPGNTLNVPFIVTYDDKNNVPNVAKVRLNGRTICQNNLVPTKVQLTKEHIEKPAEKTEVKSEEKVPEKKEVKVPEKKEEKVPEKKEEKVPEKKEEKREDKIESPRAQLDNAHHHPHH